MLEGAGSAPPSIAALLLLILPATQAAVDFMNNSDRLPAAAARRCRSSISRTAFPTDCATHGRGADAAAERAASTRSLSMDLEIRYLANRDPQPLFRARDRLGPDSDSAEDERDRLWMFASA